jgi:polyhydroxyalkanoate synthesis regulator phasin
MTKTDSQDLIALQRQIDIMGAGMDARDNHIKKLEAEIQHLRKRAKDLGLKVSLALNEYLFTEGGI